MTDPTPAAGGLTDHEVQRLEDASWKGGRQAWLAEVAAIKADAADRELARVTAAVEAALSTTVEGHEPRTEKGPLTESGWLHTACSCDEFAWPCPHVLKAQVDAARAALSSADTTLDRDEVERWADDHFTQGEVAVVMRLVDEFGWHQPRAAAVSPEGGGT